MQCRHWYSNVFLWLMRSRISKEITYVHYVSDHKVFCSMFWKSEDFLNSVLFVLKIYFTSILCELYREKRFFRVLQLKQLVSTEVSCYFTVCVWCKVKKLAVSRLHFSCPSPCNIRLAHAGICLLRYRQEFFQGGGGGQPEYLNKTNV
jgi:hypothetical protein